MKQALHEFASGDLSENAKKLLKELGYESERTRHLRPNTPERFLSVFNLEDDPDFNPERALLDEWESVDLLFQLMEEHIRDNDQVEIDFGSGDIDDTRMESYLFFAIKLNGNHYTRTQLSQITREMNKPFGMPAMILFQHGGALTFAVIDRRLNKRDESKDVLLKATLIKDINFADAHRAHVDILSDLSIGQLHEKYGFRNFEQLHEAWKKTLDTELLNRQFYQRLFEWFEWAISEAKFPENEKRTLKPEEHVIRLITRLLFVWFIKEKGLVADELFDETEVDPLLKDYDRDTGDSYYRAVLQNLFFATLNTEIKERRFSEGTNVDHRNFSVYRYKNQMNDTDALQALFDKTPFINGGLFDCLDDFKATSEGGSRIDCFSDKHYKKLSLPNRLFFDETRGLFPLLTHYKFTVEENTPIEQEVALDPELLGKVFENLLAAYNPETGTTARKQTGSYYTPRIIVDYMVEEALVAALAERVHPTDEDAKFWTERLHYLLDYAKTFDDASEWFDSRESDEVVRAISELKILDPAVGSGAFPMGVLHKLTLALRRLDPDNLRWETLQKERAGQRAAAAFDTSDQEERDAELTEISDTFERYRDSDFGRKLYLIQNSIFGVDIQSIACQIAKLRFFISLTIEQTPNKNAENFGIKPLPNLETRFVAANTLIGVQTESQLFVVDDIIQQMRSEIESIREKYFMANSRQQKQRYIGQENKLRNGLERALSDQQLEWAEQQRRLIDQKIAKIPKEKGRKQLREQLRKDYERLEKELNSRLEKIRRIARWDPYDQNASADFFDPEWMFGAKNGFDVVIGNPPYIEARNSLLSDSQKTAYGNQVNSDWGESLPRGSDLLIYFYACSAKLLTNFGNGCFITQNAWLNTDYGHRFQKFSLSKFSFVKIIDTSAKFFSDIRSQNINAIITVFTRKLAKNIEYGIADADMIITDKRAIRAKQLMKWGNILSMPEFYAEILSKMFPNSHMNRLISFGQGLNFPLNQLSNDDSDLPIIVKTSQFDSLAVDGRVRKALTQRRQEKEKIPALIMPRGIGQRHYCIFNSNQAFSYSHVELYLPDELWNSDTHYCLWLYLNSSFVWLFREITGRKNLGGGLLKAEATDMKMLPISFNFDFSQEARKIFQTLKNREPLPVNEEIVTLEHLLIDEIIADYFGFQKMEDQIRDALRAQVHFRVTRAQAQK